VVEPETEIATPDGSMKTFVAHPDGSPSPAVVVFMDALGCRGALRDVARRLADEGYYALLPDLYYRFGEAISFDVEKVIAGPGADEFDRMMAIVGRLGDVLVISDTRAILDALAAHAAAAADGPKGCVGFCMGGRFVLRALAAFPGEFAAGAALHPSFLVTDDPDSPLLALGTIAGEVYLGYGAADTFTRVETIPHVRGQLEHHEVRHVIDIHAGADHGYMLPGPAFDAEAAEAAWRETLELFRRNLEGAPVAA
jgi:carboxymethylenebutenolidase